LGPLPGTKREANPESQLGETCEETLPNGAKEVVTKTRAGRWGSRRLNRAEDRGRLRPAPDLGAKNPQRVGCHRSQLKGSSPGPCGVGWTPGGTNWKPQTRSPCWDSFTPQTVTGETGPSDQARRVRRPVDSARAGSPMANGMANACSCGNPRQREGGERGVIRLRSASRHATITQYAGCAVRPRFDAPVESRPSPALPIATG
jgi:hypothetical protein